MQKQVKMETKRKTALTIALTLINIALYVMRESDRLTLTEYEYASHGGKIPRSFDGFKIAHVSDLHNKSFGSGNNRLLSLIEDNCPDIIAISGDLLDSRHTDKHIALEFLRGAAKIAPVYYTTGNHEERFPDNELSEFLSDCKEAGAHVLTHHGVKIRRNGEQIYLFGIADKYISGERGIFCDMAKADGFKILIAHRPQFGELYRKIGADLTLSGHAHGGQARLPLIGGVIAPDQGFFPKYTEGIHRFGDSAVVISRGLGNSLIPARINNPPELVMITLRSGVE